MRLADMERIEGERRARFTTTVMDDSGEHAYGLSIAGAEDVLREMFAETDFAPAITHEADEERWNSTMQDLNRRATAGSTEVFDLERPEAFFKGDMPPVAVEESVFVSLRDPAPQGTLFVLAFPLFIPRGVSVFFSLPPVSVCSGFVLPVSGDPDLFLTLNGIATPTVSASALPGLAVDRVGFLAAPWALFVPFFRVFGFLAAATDVELAGWRIFP